MVYSPLAGNRTYVKAAVCLCYKEGANPFSAQLSLFMLPITPLLASLPYYLRHGKIITWVDRVSIFTLYKAKALYASRRWVTSLHQQWTFFLSSTVLLNLIRVKSQSSIICLCYFLVRQIRCVSQRARIILNRIATWLKHGRYMTGTTGRQHQVLGF